MQAYHEIILMRQLRGTPIYLSPPNEQRASARDLGHRRAMYRVTIKV
jgi:hypothetical protein